MFKKLLLISLLSSVSLLAEAELLTHDLVVFQCRALPTGDFHLGGVSNKDGITRTVGFTTAVFPEKVLDRYLSICLTALVSGIPLRLDLLECPSSVSGCVTTDKTSLRLVKEP